MGLFNNKEEKQIMEDAMQAYKALPAGQHVMIVAVNEKEDAILRHTLKQLRADEEAKKAREVADKAARESDKAKKALAATQEQ